MTRLEDELQLPAFSRLDFIHDAATAAGVAALPLAVHAQSSSAPARAQAPPGSVGAAGPGGRPTSSTAGRGKLLHPDAVNQRRSVLS